MDFKEFWEYFTDGCTTEHERMLRLEEYNQLKQLWNELDETLKEHPPHKPLTDNG